MRHPLSPIKDISRLKLLNIFSACYKHYQYSVFVASVRLLNNITDGLLYYKIRWDKRWDNSSQKNIVASGLWWEAKDCLLNRPWHVNCLIIWHGHFHILHFYRGRLLCNPQQYGAAVGITWWNITWLLHMACVQGDHFYRHLSQHKR